jgi:hypothetical protein
MAFGGIMMLGIILLFVGIFLSASYGDGNLGLAITVFGVLLMVAGIGYVIYLQGKQPQQYKA